jgi:hypothetical protein
MKLTTEEIEIIKLLIEDRLEANFNGPEGIENYWKTEILINLLKKLDNE